MLTLVLSSFAFALPPLVETEDTLGNTPTSTVESPIINGVEATTDDYPMTGGTLLHGVLFDFPLDTLVCSSTLIAPDVVLLAAHCVDIDVISFGMPMEDVKMWWTRQSDLTDWDGTQQGPELPTDAIEVTQWIPHENFDITSLQMGLAENYDIALLFLSEPVLDIKPAYLPTPEEDASMMEGDWVAVVGWGQQVATGQQEAPPAGTYAIKQQGDSFIVEMADFEFKVGEEVDDVRKCHGDSGGPSFWESSDGLRLVGVTSHAYDMSDCNETGGVDTRVQFYRNWIESQMVAGCENGVRVWCDEAGILEPNYFEKIEAEELEEEKGLFACSTGGFDWNLSPFMGLIGLLWIRRRNNTPIV
jgi:hypothetical protein